MPFFVDQEIQSISDFLTVLVQHCPADQVRWFRGHENADWTLSPRLSRNPNDIENEEVIISRFRQNAYQYVSASQRDEWETLYLMQHYGAPTRLLDWSESPLAALYFAIGEGDLDDQDGALWILDPVKLNSHANVRHANPRYIPLDTELTLNNYKPSVIRSEAVSSLSPIAFIAPRNSSRMVAQLGAFTVCHREMINIEDIGTHDHIGRVRIPSAYKGTFRSQLSVLRVSTMTLFPELTSVATYAGR